VEVRARRPHTSVVTKLRRPMQCCGGLNAPHWAPISLSPLDVDLTFSCSSISFYPEREFGLLLGD
jgi:hypothetical protein